MGVVHRRSSIVHRREGGLQSKSRRGLQVRKRASDRNFRRNEVDLEQRQTLSIMKACEVVGVSRRTIYNWMAGGKIEFVRTAGGSVRIFADSLWRSPESVDS